MSPSPRSVVTAPLFAPWRPGLRGATAAAGTFYNTPVTIPDDADPTTARAIAEAARWATGGIAYRPELAWLRPNPAGEGADVQGPGTFISCPEGAETDQTAKAVRPGREVVEWDTFFLYDGDSCTPMGSDLDEAVNRAVRSLELQSSTLVEQVLWTGTVNGVDFTANHPNVALASADADLPAGSTPLGVVSAFSAMVEALADTLGGARGMIHVPPSLLPHLTFYGQVQRVNDAIYTYGSDHLVVAGTGYPGTDPDGEVDPDATWIYGTSMVEYRQTNVIPVGDTMRAYGFVNRADNTIAALVERAALASWDLSAHIGIPVCTPDPVGCGTVS